jgi:WD40 repeat protein
VPDFFISYAREDEPFVQRLRDALTTRQREVWLDRALELGDGIEPGDNWRTSTEDGIERSDAFAFVLSPASLTSEPCRAELAHATGLHKRLLPVCRQEPDDDAPIPPEIRDLSWVMMRPGDDFEAGVGALIRGLETDIEIVREHTRLLVRARAWELGERRSSPLLRGDELRRAEDWLSRAASAGAPPTDSQREFIAASRAAARRRQRITVSGALTVAAVAIGLSIFALIQRSDAVHERNTAVRQRNIAYARQLDADAQASEGTDPERSLLLADRSAHVWPGQGEAALQAALSQSKILHRYPLAAKNLAGDTAWNPQGTRVLITSPGHGAAAWARIYAPGEPGAPTVTLPGPTGFGQVAWNADGDRVVIGGAHPAVYDSHSGRLIARLPQRTAHVALSPSGTRAVYLANDAVGHVFDLATHRDVATFTPRHAEVPYEMALSPDGHAVIQVDARSGGTLSTIHSDIEEWSTASGKLQRSVATDTEVSPPSFSPGGTYFAYGTLPPHLGNENATPASFTAPGTFVYRTAGTGGPALTFPQPTTTVAWGGNAEFPVLGWGSLADSIGHVYVFGSQQQYQLAGADDRIEQMGFDNANHVLAASADGSVRVYALSGGQPIETLAGDTGAVDAAAFGDGGQYVATSSTDGTARIWQGPLPSLLAARSLGLDEPPDSDAGLDWLANGRTLLFGSPNPAGGSPWDSVAEILDRTSLRRDRLLHPAHGQTFADVAVGGGVVAVSPEPDHEGSQPTDVTTYSAITGAQLATIAPTTGDPVAEFLLSPSGSTVALASGDEFEFADARTGHVISHVTDEGRIPTAAFSPDGSEFAAVRAGATNTPVQVRVWNVRTGRTIRTITGPKLTDEVQGTHDLSPEGVAFSPDDHQVALSGAAPEVDVYSTSSGARMHRWSIDHGSDGRFAGQLSFSPDGRRLAAGTGNGAYVWALPDGALTHTFHQTSGTPAQITESSNLVAVGFSANSRYLATRAGGTGGGAVSFDEWDLQTGAKLLSLSGLANAVGSPDGRRLLTVGLAGLREYSCDLCGSLRQLEALAATRVPGEPAVGDHP